MYCCLPVVIMFIYIYKRRRRRWKTTQCQPHRGSKWVMDLFSWTYNSIESAYMCAYLSLPFLSSSAQHTLRLLCTFEIPSPSFDKAKLVQPKLTFCCAEVFVCICKIEKLGALYGRHIFWVWFVVIYFQNITVVCSWSLGVNYEYANWLTSWIRMVFLLITASSCCTHRLLQQPFWTYQKGDDAFK